MLIFLKFLQFMTAHYEEDAWADGEVEEVEEHTHLEGVAELADLDGEAELGRGHDELEHGEAGAGGGVEDRQGQASLDVVDERVADARVLTAAVVLQVGRPLGRTRVD